MQRLLKTLLKEGNILKLFERNLLSSGGLFSVESMPGSAAATRRNN